MAVPRKTAYREHEIEVGYMFHGSFCPDEEHGVYLAFIEGPVVKLLLMGPTPEEAVEKAKKEIDDRLDRIYPTREVKDD